MKVYVVIEANYDFRDWVVAVLTDHKKADELKEKLVGGGVEELELDEVPD